MAFFEFKIELNSAEQVHIIQEAKRDTVIAVSRLLRQQYASHEDFVNAHKRIFIMFEINPAKYIWD